MQPILKVVLGAVLAAVIVKVAGRGSMLREFLNRGRVNGVPVVHPETPDAVNENFDSKVAPGAPF
jgi:hypothetical protein